MKDNEIYKRVAFKLNSPYEWGSGYANASSEEIEANEKYLLSVMESIGFVCGNEKHGWSCPSFYNDENKFEEIYLHPQEISGTMSLKTKDKILSYFKNNPSSVTKIETVSEYDIERQYSYVEVVNQLAFLSGLKNDSEIWSKILKTYHSEYEVPGNYDYRLLGFDFKEYAFIDAIDSNCEAQKEFVCKWLKEQIVLRKSH